MQDELFMQSAIDVARQSGDEVPIAAVAVYKGELIAQAHNASIGLNDPCAHAEILVLREAGKILQNYRLPGVSLYVTLEPCAMCAMAMIHARIDKCIFSAFDSKTGAAGSVINIFEEEYVNHRVSIEGGLLEPISQKLLKDFFKSKRK